MKIKFVEEKVMKGIMLLTTLLVFLFVGSILYTIIKNGLPALNWEMLTSLPGGGFYIGKEGGLLNAIVGSLYIVGASTVLGLVVSILLALALLFVGQSLMAALLEPELVQESTQIVENGQVAYLTKYGAPIVPNPNYLQGVSRALCTFFLYFLPTSQCFAVAFTALDYPWLLLTLAALFTALTTGAGLGLFVRKDVR